MVSARLAEVLLCNFLLKPRVEVAMETPVKILVKFCCSFFLWKRSSEVPRHFVTNLTPLSPDALQLQVLNLMAFFDLQTFVLDICHLALPNY